MEIIKDRLVQVAAMYDDDTDEDDGDSYIAQNELKCDESLLMLNLIIINVSCVNYFAKLSLTQSTI